jgi:hypothetical protein
MFNARMLNVQCPGLPPDAECSMFNGQDRLIRTRPRENAFRRSKTSANHGVEMLALNIEHLAFSIRPSALPPGHLIEH